MISTDDYDTAGEYREQQEAEHEAWLHSQEQAFLRSLED
jgi:hypothetical protein